MDDGSENPTEAVRLVSTAIYTSTQHLEKTTSMQKYTLSKLSQFKTDLKRTSVFSATDLS